MKQNFNGSVGVLPQMPLPMVVPNVSIMPEFRPEEKVVSEASMPAPSMLGRRHSMRIVEKEA